MTSVPADLLGAQAPRVCFRPPYATEAAGEEAIELASAASLDLFPWQRHDVRVALAERDDGLWASREHAELVARQNGKGGILETVVLHGMYIERHPLTLWTSHQFKTSTESFLRMKELIDGSDFLRKRVKRVNASHGEEGIELSIDGVLARLRFIARSKSSARGFTKVRRIIWDEAQESPPWAFRAMKPTQRAVPNPQVIFTGTVPDAQVNYPEHWTRLRDEGRAGSRERYSWIEYTPVGSDQVETAERIEISDRRHWVTSNPSLGYLFNEESMAGDVAELDEAGVRIELLSIWPTIDPNVEGHVLDLKRWKTSAETTHRKPKGSVVLSLDVNPERTRAAIGVASRGSGKRRTLVMVKLLEDLDLVVPTLEKLVDRREVLDLLIHPTSQAGAFIPDLTAKGIEFSPMSTTDLGQACAKFITLVKKGRIVHLGQPELDAAVKGANTRKTREAELWDRLDLETDICPLVAVSNAAFGWAQADTSGFNIY